MLLMGHTPALRVHVNREVLEDVHVAAVRDAGHARAVPLRPDELDRLGADVHHQSVDHRDVVAHSPILGIQPRCPILKVSPELRQEADWGAVLQVVVQVLLEAGLDQRGEVGHHPRRNGDLWEHVHLQVGGEWVWEAHVAREGREDEVPHLDAVGWDDIAEAVVVIAEELWEVVEEDEENSEGATVQAMHWLSKLSIPDVANNQI